MCFMEHVLKFLCGFYFNILYFLGCNEWKHVQFSAEHCCVSQQFSLHMHWIWNLCIMAYSTISVVNAAKWTCKSQPQCLVCQASTRLELSVFFFLLCLILCVLNLCKAAYCTLTMCQLSHFPFNKYNKCGRQGGREIRSSWWGNNIFLREYGLVWGEYVIGSY